jgi:DMSO reductase anchor subunit
MNPAFSVIFFTTASGAGFGALAWLGLLALGGALPSRPATLLALVLAAAFAAAGLLSSLGHLGQPQRAWRAFSQWRSSWLSREGVFASLCFLPAAWLVWLAWSSPLRAIPGVDPAYLGVASTTAMRVAGVLLTACALASVVCTAMIYASLKPIPAWRHPLVLPVYLTFGLFSGGLLVATSIGLEGVSVPDNVAVFVVGGALLLWALKWRAWRYVDADAGAAAPSRNAALGLPHTRPVHVFERPHTEANYLLKEMGYVLARRHARRLRMIALVLFALVPLLCALPVLLSHGNLGIAMTVALVFALVGTLVERWLFFAEAKHLVTLYY